MRVGIVALLQESNTFIAQATTLEHFAGNLLATGGAVREGLGDAHHEVGGFFEGLARAGVEAVPLFAARALPYGVIEAGAFDALMTMLFDAVADAGPLDGCLVAAHGATVSAEHPDADGYWLSRLRQTVGRGTPIVATIDPHANVSAAMIDATDAMIAYRTNPHVDQRDRGVEAADLIVRTIRGEVRPVQAMAAPPMAINIERQCTGESPCADLCAEADRVRREPGVLSASIVLGFPYADVAEMGSGAIVVADGDSAAARGHAHRLGRFMWDHRADFAGAFIGVEDAIDRAMALDGPVCLLDMGDNVGGGSPGDGTVIAAALHRRGIGPAFVCICDAAAVAAADRAGVGARVALDLGGHSDGLHGDPLSATFGVVSMHDGRFREAQPRHGGFTEFDMGRTAVLRTDAGLSVMATSRRVAPWSLAQLTSCGLDPASFRVLVAKGVNAPIAAYSAVCPHMIRVDTPGVTTADMRRLAYRHRRRPMYPCEQDATYE